VGGNRLYIVFNAFNSATLAANASDWIRDLLRQLVTYLNQWDSEILDRGVINMCVNYVFIG